MKNRFKLYTIETHTSDAESESDVAASPGSLGVADLSLDASPVAVAVAVAPSSLNQPSLELPSAPSSPRSTSSSAMERDMLQTFNGLEALHNLPRMQRCQLPLDLYDAMVALVPAGEETSFLFRYLFISRLPTRLRVFAKGLGCLPNELLANVCDYLWGFWSDTDPAGLWHHRSTCRFARIDPARRGGLAREYLPRRPVLTADRVRGVPGSEPDCECWSL